MLRSDRERAGAFETVFARTAEFVTATTVEPVTCITGHERGFLNVLGYAFCDDSDDYH